MRDTPWITFSCADKPSKSFPVSNIYKLSSDFLLCTQETKNSIWKYILFVCRSVYPSVWLSAKSTLCNIINLYRHNYRLLIKTRVQLTNSVPTYVCCLEHSFIFIHSPSIHTTRILIFYYRSYLNVVQSWMTTYRSKICQYVHNKLHCFA